MYPYQRTSITSVLLLVAQLMSWQALDDKSNAVERFQASDSKRFQSSVKSSGANSAAELTGPRDQVVLGALYSRWLLDRFHSDLHKEHSESGCLVAIYREFRAVYDEKTRIRVIVGDPVLRCDAGILKRLQQRDAVLGASNTIP